MPPINSRRKGANFERDIARALRAVWPDARRRGGAQADGRGCEPDVDGTPFWIECKRTKTSTHAQRVAWLEQATREACASPTPRPTVLIARENGRQARVYRLDGPWLSACPLVHWIALHI